MRSHAVRKIADVDLPKTLKYLSARRGNSAGVLGPATLRAPSSPRFPPYHAKVRHRLPGEHWHGYRVTSTASYCQEGIL